MRIYRISLLLALSLILALTPGCSGDDPVQPLPSDPVWDCVDYQDNLHVSSFLEIPTDHGRSGEMIVADDLAYVANGDEGLVIVDVSDPEDARFVSQFPLPIEPQGLEVVDGYAYVACGDSKEMVIVDVSDPENPTFVSSMVFENHVADVAVMGSHAYVGVRNLAVQVVDVRDPATPVLGEWVSTGASKRVVAEGSRLFVAGWSEVHVLDLADPAGPMQVESFGFGPINDLAVQGDLLYAISDFKTHVVDHFTGTVIFDDLVVGGGYEAERLVVRGTEALLLFRWGVSLWDVGDPAAPAPVGSVPVVEPFGIGVTSERIYVAHGKDGFQTIVKGPPVEAAALGVATLSHYYNMVSVDGSLAALGSSWEPRFGLVDIGDPEAPVVESDFEMLSIEDLYLSNSFAYVAQGPRGFQVVDVTDPGTPKLRGNVLLPGSASGVVVTEDLALVAANDAGLQVVDVADPDAPTIIGAVDTPGMARRVAHLGDLVLVADFDAGLQVVDGSDPTAPVIVGSLATPGRAWSVTVSDGLVYVADEYSLLVVDISTPSSPVIIGSLASPNRNAENVVVHGTLAYVFEFYSGLMIADVSDPNSPTLVVGPGPKVGDGAAFAVSPYGFGIVVGEEIATVPLQCGSERGPQWW